MKRLLFMLQLIFSVIGYTQDLRNQNENIERVSLKIDEQINTVYDSNYFVGREFVRESLRTALKERVSIAFKEGVGQNSDYPLLSSVGVTRGVNSKIASEMLSNFNENTFNPLCFNINLFPLNESIVYRIDNTDFILVIQHQNLGK